MHKKEERKIAAAVKPEAKEDKNDDGLNPYIAVLNKKLRNINKKLEKVKSTELALEAGKVCTQKD